MSWRMMVGQRWQHWKTLVGWSQCTILSYWCNHFFCFMGYPTIITLGLVGACIYCTTNTPAYPAQENTSGSRLVCGSVALDTSTDELSKRLANSVYDKCRAGSLSLQGFPSFDPLVQALRNGVSETNRAEYQVCAPVTSLHFGSTVI